MDQEYFFPCESESDCEENVKNVINIYEHLGDETSKYIFERRLLYSFTNDYRYIRQIISKSEGGKAFLLKLESLKEKDIFIYGAGIKGSRLIRLFPELNWKGYVDIAKKGKRYRGLNIYGLEKVMELKNKGFFVISVQMHPEAIRETLISLGVYSENIIILKDYDAINAKNIYFDDEIIKTNDINKMFADIGSFDGNDMIRYLERFENAGGGVCVRS